MTKNVGLLSFLFAVVVASVPAQGAYMTYTTASSFSAAAPSTTTETFNNKTPFSYISSGSSGVTLSTPNGGPIQAYPSNVLGLAASYGETVYAQDASLTVLLPNSGSFKAASIEVGLYNTYNTPTGADLTIQVLTAAGNGPTATVHYDNGALLAFFGVTATGTDTITGFKITAPLNKPAIEADNVSFGPSSAVVPEPASLALLGLGLAGVGLSAFRRRMIQA